MIGVRVMKGGILNGSLGTLACNAVTGIVLLGWDLRYCGEGFKICCLGLEERKPL
jgi:hypothetical protein